MKSAVINCTFYDKDRVGRDQSGINLRKGLRKEVSAVSVKCTEQRSKG
jgi:hypothetical protein